MSTTSPARRHTEQRLPYSADDLLPADQQVSLIELIGTLPPRNADTHSPSETLSDTLLIVEHGRYEPQGCDISNAIEILGCLMARKFASSGMQGLRNCLSERAHEILCQAAAVGHS